jgi:predicted permease
MIRSFLKVHAAGMGVESGRLLVGTMALPAARYPGAEAQVSFFDRLKVRLGSLPGVESMALAGSLPSWFTGRLPYELPGDQPAGRRGRPKLAVLTVSPGYFRTVGASVLGGRDFNRHDDSSGAPVAIVNERLASKFWPGQDAAGKRIRLFDGNEPGPWLTVVGVSSNIIQNDQTRQQFDPVLYVPYAQKPSAAMWVFARTGVPPGTLATEFRRQVRAIDPDLPVYGPFSLNDRLESWWDNRFYGILFLIFAGIALLLASVGLYTVIAHSVGRRTQEIGIRMAMGGTPQDILGLIFRQGMLPLATGLIAGLAVSIAVNRLLKSELVQVSPSDPVTLMVASGVLIMAGALGCLIPARRAMRVDPVVALRHD